ncbi:DUF11 domain-containing protein [Phyllobacterium salinisoli]|uniref:DUF11 domain-containing protein n=1 Tax=Phyllobacterium salinisoli TaxID=1899321 RepID=A0A368K0P2_9HYPH|nr:CshA/CshB family fibrillar adhesin-related protein [Phyllobacterium salinisoli]RCS22958.1 DUF11 domain-containing protein [Phyllobacterium salinisoli]
MLHSALLCNYLRRFADQFARAAIVWLAIMAFAAPAHAQLATGGTGLYKNSIFWVSWGTAGTNVFSGRSVIQSFNIGSPATSANQVDLTCTLSNAVNTAGAAVLNVYRPGGWQGDGLDELYNIGGNQAGGGTNPNTLAIGLATGSGATVEFDFSCTATLGGAPLALRGLVFADAESSGSNEYVGAELPGGSTLRVIDQISQCGASTQVTISGSEVRFTGPAAACQNDANPARRAGPALVGYLEGATSARVIAKGGGVSAIAVGAMLDIEYSEAVPSSYGVASHILEPVWSGGQATAGVNYNNPANLATRGFGVSLGSAIITDQNENNAVGGPDVDALRKTTGPLGAGYADVPMPSNTPGSTYQITGAVCRGPAAIAGWIDFNGNGVFDAGERSDTVNCPAGSSSVTLSWIVPSDYAIQSTSYMRLRAATDSSDIAEPATIASDGETEDYYIQLLPADLAITKDDGASTYAPGGNVTYSIVVTNNGPAAVTGAKVSDPLPAGITTASWTCGDVTAGAVCGAASGTGAIDTTADLPVGASLTYEFAMSVPADFTGDLTNTATVAAPAGVTETETSNNSASDTDVQGVPGLTIDKTGALSDLDGDGLLDPGETISYAFLVTNTGTVTLTNVTVNDPKITVDEAPQTLAPGGNFTFHASYTPTQAEIDAGQVSNTATGTGTPPSGPPTESPPDTVVVPPDQTPGLTIDKTGTLNDLDGDGLLDPGESVSYAFLVRNTGSVTLTNVTVNDPKVTVDEAPQTLAPGGSFTFHASYTPTQTEIDAGEVSNTATGVGTPPSGQPTESPPDTVVVPPEQASGMTINKTGTLNDLDSDGLLDPGETVSYSFLVRNTGAVTLTNVTVSDPLLANANVALDQGPQTLAPGASFTFTATYTPTQDEIDSGSVSNTATGTGTPPSGPPEESPPDTVVVPPDETPGLMIDKTGTLNDLDGDGLIDPGETISYAFLVTNTGSVTLTAVTVNDAKVTVNEGPQTLAPSGRFTFHGTYTPTQGEIDAGQVSNTATGTGTPPSGPPVESPPDTVVVPPEQTPGLTIEKSGTLNDLDGDDLIDLGETISYSFLVRNTGTVTMSEVTVNDPLLTDAGVSVMPGPQVLAPGGSVTFTATFTPRQAHIDAGRVENTATPTGTPPSGPPLEGPPDNVVVPPEQTSGITIDKTGTLNDQNGNNLIDPGETITYAFVVKNTGTVTLTNVTVNDPLLANAGVTLNEGPQALAPGADFTFTASYMPTQSDIEAGSVTNTATGIGTPPSAPTLESPPDTVVVPPVEISRLTIEKTGTFNDVDGNGYANLGDTMSYSFTVTNTGGQVISDVAPVDAGPTFNGKPATATLSAFAPASVTLAARAAQAFTATYTLTQEDIDNAAGVTDGIVNAATAKGNVGGTPVPSNTSTSKVTMPAVEPSDISIVKQAGLRQIKRGEKAPFTIKVTNHSSRNAGTVVVTDIIPSGFRFIDGSAMIDGVAATPVVVGQKVRFDNVALGPNAEVIIRLQMLALSSAGPGKHTNKAAVNGLDGGLLAPEARADIEIMIEPVFDCGDIVGKVFDDLNRNGYQDQGEPGLPGVRIATVRGSLVTTDRHGRFHVACADLPDSRIGTNFIMKLDPRTLPAGYRLTTENPRVIRLTAGKMSTLNFGASIGRVVRLDLMDAAFEPGAAILKRQWQEGIEQLIKALEGEPSTLRIGYGATSDAELARRRIKAIEEDISQRWRSVRGRYELNIETRVEAVQ